MLLSLTRRDQALVAPINPTEIASPESKTPTLRTNRPTHPGRPWTTSHYVEAACSDSIGAVVTRQPLTRGPRSWASLALVLALAASPGCGQSSLKAPQSSLKAPYQNLCAQRYGGIGTSVSDACARQHERLYRTYKAIDRVLDGNCEPYGMPGSDAYKACVSRLRAWLQARARKPNAAGNAAEWACTNQAGLDTYGKYDEAPRYPESPWWKRCVRSYEEGSASSPASRRWVPPTQPPLGGESPSMSGD
jgi:hypothetical protein